LTHSFPELANGSSRAMRLSAWRTRLGHMSTLAHSTLRTAILVGIFSLLMSGCGFVDPLPKLFRVTNHTQQVLVIREKEIPGKGEVAFPGTPKSVSPGGTVTFVPTLKGCESHAWVATSEAGDTIAEIPGGCIGHDWTIRGVNDSSYD